MNPSFIVIQFKDVLGKKICVEKKRNEYILNGI